MTYTPDHRSTLPTFGKYRPTALDMRGLGSTEDDRDWIVCPVTYQPKLDDLLSESNWECQLRDLERAAKRVDRARRHIRHRLIPEVRGNPYRPVERFAETMCRHAAYIRLVELVDLPAVEGETVAAFAERLDAAREQGDYTTHYFGHWTSDFKIAIVRPGSQCHRVAVEIELALADYPVLDDSDFSRRECEAQYESVLSELHRLELERNDEALSDDAINELADQICQQASDNECMNRADVEKALSKFGWTECDDSVWRPDSETEEMESEE